MPQAAVSTVAPSKSRSAQRPGQWLNWLQAGISALIDPDRKERIQRFTSILHHELVTQKHGFQPNSTAKRAGMTADELREASEELYVLYLQNSWKDELLTECEGKSLNFIGKKLELPQSRLAALNWLAGEKVFEQVYSRAIADGSIDDQEFKRLEQVACGIGTTLPQLMQGYFRAQGEQFLRAMFASMISDGKLSPQEWNHILATTSRLGVSRQQLLQSVMPHAKLLVEHVLADAKSDERLSPVEQQAIQWLLSEFPLPPEFQSYVQGEVRELKTISDAAQGKLPVVSDPRGVELRSGEIPHFQCAGAYVQLKRRRGEFIAEPHDGVITITDHRLLFSSPTKVFELNLRRIVEVMSRYNGIEIRSTSKGGGTYRFGQFHRLAFAILRTSVGRANQKIVDPSAGVPSSHIPRDVRQRVWQRYGGRCADCGSDQYLEFDHIVPRARGGSNSDNNVQLLCRRCNLKKSDNI